MENVLGSGQRYVREVGMSQDAEGEGISCVPRGFLEVRGTAGAGYERPSRAASSLNVLETASCCSY